MAFGIKYQPWRLIFHDAYKTKVEYTPRFCELCNINKKTAAKPEQNMRP
jgi:hypothetical protein